MIEQATIDYMLNTLKDCGLIANGYRGNIKFTGAGNTYTTKRSRDSWCDITWTYDGAIRYWMPVKVFSESSNKYEWAFHKINEINDEEFELFCKYFEIYPDNSVIAIDIDELCL